MEIRPTKSIKTWFFICPGHTQLWVRKASVLKAEGGVSKSSPRNLFKNVSAVTEKAP
jgi:hypothetical protein